jgi:hypothetical protein
MAFIIITTFVLLAGGLPATLIIYFSRKRTIHHFQKLSEETGLNFALPKRKNILENPKPALVGDYKNRLVNMTTQIKDNISFTEIAMSCNTRWTAEFEAKSPFKENYIYNLLYKSKSKPILTGDSQFDGYFFIKVTEEEAVKLFNESVRKFLLSHFHNINFEIEIRGYEIVVNDSNLPNSDRTGGGSIAENTVYMLDFLTKLADLLEQKRLV